MLGATTLSELAMYGVVNPFGPIGLNPWDPARTGCAVLRRNVAEGLHRAGADAIVTPTWPFAAPRIGDTTILVHGATMPVDPHRTCFVRAANAADACAITLPIRAYLGAGVPAGLHLMADRERAAPALRGHPCRGGDSCAATPAAAALSIW